MFQQSVKCSEPSYASGMLTYNLRGTSLKKLNGLFSQCPADSLSKVTAAHFIQQMLQGIKAVPSADIFLCSCLKCYAESLPWSQPVGLRQQFRDQPQRFRRQLQRPTGETQGASGNGLIGMRERALSVDGSLLAGPMGDGWSVELSVPLGTTRTTGAP